jgi:NIMA (never in mitosis gene a)-related kinase
MAARSTFEDFIIKEKIGSGSYGVVFKVIRKVDKQVYAMKEIDLQGMSRKVRLTDGRQGAGRGAAGGLVACCCRLHRGHRVCVQEQEECIRETRVLSSLDSDYIIRYYDSFLEKVSLPEQARGDGVRSCRARWRTR